MRGSAWLPLLAALLNGCGGETRDGNPPASAAKPQASQRRTHPKPEETPIAAAEPWGVVKGRIVWGDKESPKRQPIVVPTTHNDFKFCTKDGEFLDDTWVVDPKTMGLKDTFVWLAPADKDGKLLIHPSRATIAPDERRVVMDQPVCMFMPRAVALREGQILIAKNSSKVLHNFKWSGTDQGGNPSIPAGQQEELKIVADRLPIGVECGIHPWMRATIMAFDHPYFAVTDAQGRFEIKQAPAGACRLMIRHNTGIWLGGVKGRYGRPIDIQAGDNDLGALEYPPPNN